MKRKNIIIEVATERHMNGNGIEDVNFIMEVMKEFGRSNNNVWLYNVATQEQIDLKYDNWRRYYISNVSLRNGKRKIKRVSYLDFVKAMCDYTNRGFLICF